MARRYASLKDIKKHMRPRRVIGPERVREILTERPESYGGKVKGAPYQRYNDTVKLNAYGELLEEPAEPVFGKPESTSNKYGKHGTESALKHKPGGLEKATRMAGIVGLIGGLFFLSSNITGNVIGINQTSSNWIGGILFFIGIIGIVTYFKRR